MVRPILIGAASLAAALTLLSPRMTPAAADTESATATAPQPDLTTAAQPIPQEPSGHLLLVVTGNATALTVEHAVAKTVPWHGPQQRATSYQFCVMDQGDQLLGRYPMDLSMFDLDVKSIGKGVRVEGCKVVDTRVSALISIPNHPDAVRAEIINGDTVVGSIDQARWAELVGTDKGDNR